MASVTAREMAIRMREYTHGLSFRGMTQACKAGLRPVRRQVKKRNYGFRDRTGQTRKNIGLIRGYKPSYAQRRGGGGAYFRGGSIAAARLEYDYGEKYSFIRPAQRANIDEMETSFIREARKQSEREAARARRRR